MRTLSGTLLSEQKKYFANPYLRVHLVSADEGTTYTFTTADSPSRLWGVLQREEVWGGIARIQLKNHDYYFNTKNLRGYKVQVGWGYVANGNEYSNAPDMWVIDQRDVSDLGELLTELVCIDLWNLLERDMVLCGGTSLVGTITGSDAIGEKLTGGDSGATGTIYYIGDGKILVVNVTGTFQAEVATSASLSIDIDSVSDVGSGGAAPAWSGDTDVKDIITALLTGWANLTLDSDDPSDNADTYMPTYVVPIGTSIRAAIRDVLEFTECGLRAESDGVHMFYLDPSPEGSPDYDYKLDITGVHKFVSENRDRAIVTPNRIFVVSSSPTSAVPEYISSAVDTDSYNALGYYLSRVITIPTIASQADADARASALINRAKAEVNTGEIVTPLLNCGQEVLDWIRIIDARSNNLTIEGRLGAIEREFRSGAYRMALRLGGLTTSADVTPEAVIIPSGSTEGANPVEHTPESIPPALLAPGAQAYIADIEFTAVDQDDLSWASGTIKVKSGATQSIDSGSKNLANVNPYYGYFIWGSSTLQWTQDCSATIGEDRGLVCVAKKAADADQKCFVANYFKQSILINRDQVMDDLVTSLQIAANAVTEAKIAASAVTGGKIAANSIVGTHIQSSQIDSAHINAGAVVADKIGAGAVTAVKIDAAAVEASKLAATIILSSIIWAGENKVKLDATGLTIYGQTCRFYNSSQEFRGDIYGYGPNLVIAASGGLSIGSTSGITISGFTSVSLSRMQYLYPNGSSSYLGSSGAGDYWYRVYADTYYGKNTSIQAFQKHDDIELVKQIKSKKVKGKDVIDFDSLPDELKAEGEFIHLGNMSSLALGTLAQLIGRVEALEKGGK